MNKVILKGNVGSDPEFKTFDNGGSVAEFSMATNRKYKDRNEELVEETQWHRVKVYGNRADVIQRYVSKGDPLLVEGRLTYRQYEDKDGNARYITEVILEDFHFLGGSGLDTGSAESAPEKTKKSSTTKGKKSTAKKTAKTKVSTEDDDLPF